MTEIEQLTAERDQLKQELEQERWVVRSLLTELEQLDARFATFEQQRKAANKAERSYEKSARRMLAEMEKKYEKLKSKRGARQRIEDARTRDIVRCARDFIIEADREPGDSSEVIDAYNALRASVFPSILTTRRKAA